MVDDYSCGRFWWMSFTDAELPEGSQFLGACVVEALDEFDAMTTSHLLGINPGGQVLIAGPVSGVPPEQPVGVLLTREQIAAIDAAIDEREARAAAP